MGLSSRDDRERPIGLMVFFPLLIRWVGGVEEKIVLIVVSQNVLESIVVVRDGFLLRVCVGRRNPNERICHNAHIRK